VYSFRRETILITKILIFKSPLRLANKFLREQLRDNLLSVDQV